MGRVAPTMTTEGEDNLSALSVARFFINSLQYFRSPLGLLHFNLQQGRRERTQFGSLCVHSLDSKKLPCQYVVVEGAREARGQILVFLDSHCECGVGWLQPLLQALLQDRKKVVSPYIDVIKSESFTYVQSPDDLQGDFNWRLEFGWRAIPPDVLTTRAGPHQPISTPVISGGLFAVDRDFFYNIGSYDDLMDIWGGENMELSFRVWMCGGSLEILPCSRVGHVFRNLVPYSFPADPHTTVLTNLARAANVWMDQYSRFFFAAVNMSSSDTGDVTSRVALREQLRCRSFQWYLDSVATHLDIPSPHATHFGQLKNKGSLLCLTAKFGSPDDLRLEACQGGKNQTIQLFLSGVLEAGGGCVVPGPNKHLTLYGCHLPQPQWNLVDGQLRLDKTGLCVTSVDNEFVRLAPCVSGSFFQLWEASFTFSWLSSAAIPDG
ncbi:hypothetical protein C0Q70_08755 [Pomacea canaliculata]|uniref:Polypeptide N-acetylgalactosaminyltransferase n=1 Tax=Pomacea canaliculata TaxID=400727 RepID=A0A2T7P7V2_POMCA|nr:hypothetical protein C0Q70_08755 [Pomacea canaliculata]